MVSQFLDYARPYRGEPHPLDANEAVRKTAQLLTPPPLDAGTPPVEVSLSLSEALPRAKADPEQLRQVFLNLAINAVQAMPKGGKLIISTALRSGGGRRRTASPAQFVEIRFALTPSKPGFAGGLLVTAKVPLRSPS